ncbi:hypothetical protein LVJ94_21515 [Pendulispora rubella]|uniref:Uncharacterized protein n=1 Tax=Pendulispora rubella TaxID=2741070 RepID=A0ABZ2LJ75_9BACT
MEHFRERFEQSRLRLSHLGAACAFIYVLAAGVQQVILGHFPAHPSPAQALLIRCETIDLLRATLILLAILMGMVVFVAIAAHRVRSSPGAVLLGLPFAVLWVALELWYRSIDLFVVSLQWARAYRVATDDALEQQLLERTIQWDGIVTALYFPLLLVLLVAVICFAFALGTEPRWKVRVPALGWSLYGTTVLARILGGYAGLAWLEPFNDRAYFPAVILAYGTTAIWLWSEGPPWATV